MPYLQGNIYYVQEELRTIERLAHHRIGFGLSGGLDLNISRLISIPIEATYVGTSSGGMNDLSGFGLFCGSQLQLLTCPESNRGGLQFADRCVLQPPGRIDIEKSFDAGPVHIVRSGVSVSRLKNQHYLVGGLPVAVWLGADRRIVDALRLVVQTERRWGQDFTA